MGINHFVSNMYSIDELTKLVSAASERLNVSVMKYFVMLLFFVKKILHCCLLRENVFHLPSRSQCTLSLTPGNIRG